MFYNNSSSETLFNPRVSGNMIHLSVVDRLGDSNAD